MSKTVIKITLKAKKPRNPFAGSAKLGSKVMKKKNREDKYPHIKVTFDGQ